MANSQHLEHEGPLGAFARKTGTARDISRREFLRRSAIGFGAGGALWALAACAPVTTPSGQPESEAAPTGATTELSFLTQGGTEDAFQRYEPLIESFQAANPDISVTPIWEPGGAIEIQTKLLTLIAAGEGPDTYWAHSYTNAGQAKRNIQLDLAPMIEADGTVSGDDFLPAAWLDFQIDGRQIGFPRETTSTILIYNKTLFDEHGLATPTDPWTWADFENAAATITEGEGAERIYGTADWNLNRNTWIRLWQKGGDVLNEDRTQYIMNNEIGVEQVRVIADWHHGMGVHIPGVEMGGFTTGDLFTTGRIGMFPQFSVFNNVMASEFEWDIAHLPLDESDTRTTRVASAGHSIYSGTENPDAAWKWFTHISSPDAFWNYLNLGLSIPSLRAVAEHPDFLSSESLPPNAQIMLDAFEYGRPEPVAGDWIGVHREVQPALDSIYGIEQADAQVALDAIADRVNELIAVVPSA